jgi:superfamily I DNA/RNA helicase
MRLPERAQIILGPPGTGKTTTLLGLLEKELENGTEPERIGFFTFTKQAVKEGKSRALDKFEVSQKQLPYFRTLHSLCFLQLGLSKDSVLSPSDFIDLNEILNLRLSGAINNDDGHITSVSKDDQLLFIENLARIRQVPLEQQWQEVDTPVGWFELERFARGLNLFKKNRMLLDYTDMLERFLKRGVAPSLDVMFVDEAQDLSPLQWAVVRKLCEKADRIYIAGDDDQAIYRWAGADVDYLIKNATKALVLKQSFRIPSLVHEIATHCIDQVSSRIRKNWNPRKEAGQVQWEASYEHINMSESDWLVLARTNYLLEGVEEHCRSEGWFFKKKNWPSISEKKIKAVRDWEKFRVGHGLLITELINILNYQKIPVPKPLQDYEFDKLVFINDVLAQSPKLKNEDWHDCFHGLSVKERSYIRAMLRRGERITKEPRIRLSTIHAAKGTEATNVVLLTDLSRRIYDSYKDNPEDESRVFYVGLTRAKQNLFLIEPKSQRCFSL